MKYTISLGVRAKGFQLLELTEEEKDSLLEEELDEIFMPASRRAGCLRQR